VEAAALEAASSLFPEAHLTRGSGSTHNDGDIEGVGELFVECKGSEKPGRGRSIGKKDWEKAKSQAYARALIPTHVGFDDDGDLVALVPWSDLVALMHAGMNVE